MKKNINEIPVNATTLAGADQSQFSRIRGYARQDWDLIVDPGAYVVNDDSYEGFPTGSYKYGVLIVDKGTTSGTAIIQKYYPHHITSGGVSKEALYPKYRVKYEKSWSGWRVIETI